MYRETVVKNATKKRWLLMMPLTWKKHITYCKSWHSKAKPRRKINLAQCMKTECTLPRITKKAYEWFEKAARQNYAKSQANIGRLYTQGLGVTQDYNEAREWFEKAAAQNYADAQFALGVSYEYGHGVTQDYNRAKQWYEKVAAQDDKNALNNLGMMYLDGKGVEQDYT